MRTKITSAILLLGAFHALIAVGCAGSIGSAEAALLESEALEQVDLSDVASASSSCEGLLGSVTSFAVLGETGLIVGVDEIGAPVCIDTVEAVQTELSLCGRLDDAGALESRYLETVHLREARSGQIVRPTWNDGDPDPEPNEPPPEAAAPEHERAMQTVMTLFGV